MKNISSYCLYYIPKGSEGLNDVLMISFSENNLVDDRKLDDKIISMFYQKELVGLALLEFSNIVKIKIDGTIFLPNSYLLKAINDYLSSHNVEIYLEEKDNSGFVVGKLIEKQEVKKSYIYKVDIKDEIIDCESSFDLPLNNLVCIAKIGTYLLPGRIIKEYQNKDGVTFKGRICTYDDLQMNVSNSYLPLLVQEDELEIGSDFFMMEERNDVRN